MHSLPDMKRLGVSTSRWQMKTVHQLLNSCVSAQKPELVPWLHTVGSSLRYPGPHALALGKAVGNSAEYSWAKVTL